MSAFTLIMIWCSPDELFLAAREVISTLTDRIRQILEYVFIAALVVILVGDRALCDGDIIVFEEVDSP